MPKPQNRRGRPSETDRTKVAEVALRLFERRGFEPVTMDDVARAAKCSRRTLFRLFRSKADLVWEGLDEVLAILEAQLKRPELKHASLSQLLRELVMPVLGAFETPEAAPLARRKLRLIASSLELLNHQTLVELRGVFARAVAASRQQKGVPADLVANSLVAVTFSAMLWWAQQDQMSAQEAVTVALEAVVGAAQGAGATTRR